MVDCALFAEQIEKRHSFERPYVNKYTTKENKYARNPAGELFYAAWNDFQAFWQLPASGGL
jgi:hypothetical protein